jgi:transcription elongation factor
MTLSARTLPKERRIKMEKDNLLGAPVRIRRGWHGGRTGIVTVFERHSGQTSSYVEIKVQLKGSGQIVTISSEEELDKIIESPVEPTGQ